MTDITELAPAMKAAAEKLGGAQWQTRKGSSGIEVIVKGSLEKCSGFTSFQPVAADLADTKTARAIALFSPANILALVEALEKAQAKATQQGNIACALLDEVTQLRRDADEKAPELRAQLIEADSELESLRQRIADLEPISAAAEKLVRCKGRYHSEQNYRALAALFGVTAPDLPPLDGESRTVTVKMPRPGFITISGERTAVYLKDDIDAVLAAAGIREDE